MESNNASEMKIVKKKDDETAKPSYEELVNENNELKQAYMQLMRERQTISRLSIIMDICKSINFSEDMRLKAEKELDAMLWPNNEKE